MISNIPDGQEEADDLDFVEDFAKELDVDIQKDNIRKTFRVKRRNQPNKPMLFVEFYRESDKLKLLDYPVFEKMKTTFVAGHRYHKYFVSHDRTIKQREPHQNLVAQADAKNAELQSTGNPTKIIYIVRNEAVTPVKKRDPPGQPV